MKRKWLVKEISRLYGSVISKKERNKMEFKEIIYEKPWKVEGAARIIISSS